MTEPKARADAFVVLFGAVCPMATLVAMWWAPPLEAAFGVGGIALFAAYLLRKPWARAAIFALPAAGIGLAIPHGMETVLLALGPAAAGGALAAVAWRSPRNRAAFGLDAAGNPRFRLRGLIRACESIGSRAHREGIAAEGKEEEVLQLEKVAGPPTTQPSAVRPSEAPREIDSQALKSASGSGSRAP